MIEPCNLDLNLFLLLNGDGGSAMDAIMWFVTGKFTWIPLYLIFVWLIVRKFGWKIGVLWLLLAGVMILFTDQTCTFAKNHFSKFRPTHNPDLQGLVHTVNGYKGGLYGTLSSHAANSMAFALYSMFSLGWIKFGNRCLEQFAKNGLQGAEPKKNIKLYIILMFVWVALVSYSRIYLGVHYPMDILLGLLCGAFWGIGIFLLFCRVLEAVDRIKND